MPQESLDHQQVHAELVQARGVRVAEQARATALVMIRAVMRRPPLTRNMGSSGFTRGRVAK